MKKETIMRFISVPTAKGLCGARRVAMMLLMTMLTSIGAWADAVNLSTDNDLPEGTAGHYYVNMPTTGTNTLTLPNASITTFKVYDDGGKGGDTNNNATGNYSHNCDGYLVITAPTGYVINLSGSIITNWDDELTVYNGDTSDTKLLDKISSKGKDVSVSVTSTGNVMTLYFHSNGYSNYTGLDLTVTIVSPNNLQYAIITGVESIYGRTSSAVSITPDVKAANNTQLTLDTHFTATLDGNNVSSFPFEVSDAGDHTLTITGKGDYTGAKSVSFHVYTLDGITYDNDGGYYIMDEAQDFEELATFVNAGYNCDGLTFKMTGPVQFGDGTGTGAANHTPIGDNSNSFKGTFDGQDNTIRGLIVNGTTRVGLFGNVSGTIKNVTLTNSNIKGPSVVGGIVGYGNGCNVNNCHVTSSVSVLSTDHNFVGGIIGQLYESGLVTYCSSAASVKGFQSIGGIVGQKLNGSSVSYCIYTGTELTSTYNDNYGTIAGSNLGSDNQVSNCYTTNPMESKGKGVNGKMANITAPTTGLYSMIAIGSVTVYEACTIEYSDRNLANGVDEVSVVLVVKDVAGNTFTAGTDYSVIFSATPIAIGDYTMTITGISARCGGSTILDFSLETLSFTGNGTSELPYLIDEPEELTQLAKFMKYCSFDTTDKIFKLDADLDFKGKTFTPIGTNENRFNGVFDGQNHKITNVTLSAYEAGIFGYAENATVKNLYLDNCDFTNTGGKAGCVAANIFTSTVENCHVSNTVNFTNSGSYAGGIVGDSDTSSASCSFIRACTSAYNVVGSTYSCGGILGRGYASLNDNLYYGTQLSGVSALVNSSNYNDGYYGKEAHYGRNLTTTEYTGSGTFLYSADVVTCADDLNATFDFPVLSNQTKDEVTYGDNTVKVVFTTTNGNKDVKGIYFGGKVYVRHTGYYSVNLSPKRSGYTSITYRVERTSVACAPNGENDSYSNAPDGRQIVFDEHWYAVYDITLADDADNAAIIDAFDGAICNVTLSGHKFYKDNEWNTICLPFDFDATCNDTQTSQLGEIRVKELDADNSSLDADGKLTLAFTSTTDMKAGKPYIIKWPTMSATTTENPTISGVTIDKKAAGAVSFTNNKTTGDCQFVGSYAPLSINDANRNEILLLAAGNKLGYAKTDRTLGAFRAYFNIPANANAPAISSYELNFGDDDENTTGIIEVNTNLTNNTNKAEGIFDLQGRKVANPSKGLYIVNGKKIVIK